MDDRPGWYQAIMAIAFWGVLAGLGLAALGVEWGIYLAAAALGIGVVTYLALLAMGLAMLGGVFLAGGVLLIAWPLAKVFEAIDRHIGAPYRRLAKAGLASIVAGLAILLVAAPVAQLISAWTLKEEPKPFDLATCTWDVTSSSMSRDALSRTKELSQTRKFNSALRVEDYQPCIDRRAQELKKTAGCELLKTARQVGISHRNVQSSASANVPAITRMSFGATKRDYFISMDRFLELVGSSQPQLIAGFPTTELQSSPQCPSEKDVDVAIATAFCDRTIDAFLDRGCVPDDSASNAIVVRSGLFALVRPQIVVVPKSGDANIDQEVRAALKSGNVELAKMRLRPLADTSIDALHVLGVLEALSESSRERREGYRKVSQAAGRSLLAKANLGLLQMLGIGTFIDAETGSRLVQEAISDGLTLSDATWLWRSSLGSYQLGLLSEALQELQHAARAGDAVALALIGTFASLGITYDPCEPFCRELTLAIADQLETTGSSAWAALVRGMIAPIGSEEVQAAGVKGVLAARYLGEDRMRELAATSLATAEVGELKHPPPRVVEPNYNDNVSTSTNPGPTSRCSGRRC